ncbi:ABC transporter substrate-binding protein [Roseococcus sp. XZZS9]|uniref:ABC transporter substrate-binding protein n=2 Tax=Roseococcus pinisoli TaxID=2835040 RepID=A0ABS5QEB8_9PROT|nr:ABC transporter substrate-binding protein [Roseococcus pinisoli]
MTMKFTRRALAGGATALLAAPALAQSTPILRIGNQKGGLRSLIDVSGQGRDLPYRIEWSEFPAAAPLLEALNANAIDLGTQGDLAFLSVFANGAPIKAIGATRHDQASQAILVRGDGPIRTIEDLRGKKVAGNRGGWGQFLVRAALKRANIDPAEVTIVPLGPTDASLAFRSGAVDGWAIWEPYNSIEILGFGARVLVDGTGLTPTANFLSVHDNTLRDKRPLLQDFLQRNRRGWAWALNNIPAFAQNTSELTRIPVRFLQRAYEVQRSRAVPIDAPLIAELQAASDAAVEFGVFSRPIRVADAFDTGFTLTDS